MAIFIYIRMTENATHIIVHHYLENSSNLTFIIMVCCVTFLVIVLMLLTVAGIAIYAIIRSKECRHSSNPSIRQSLTSRVECSPENISEEISSCNAVSTPASTVRDFGMDVSPNVQAISMTTFRRVNSAEDSGCGDYIRNTNVQSVPISAYKRERGTEDIKCGDSSGSSAGLYDVLFPRQHEGEIIYERPLKLFASTRNKSPENPGFGPSISMKRNYLMNSNFGPSVSTKNNSLVNSNFGTSVSGIDCDTASESLEWDYFQTPSFSESATSEVESEVDPSRIVNVCWV